MSAATLLTPDETSMLHAYAEWVLAVSRCGKNVAKLPRQPKGGTPLLVRLLGPGELFKLSFAQQAALCDTLAPGREATTRKPSALAAMRDALSRIVKDADSEPDGGVYVSIHRANIEHARGLL